MSDERLLLALASLLGECGSLQARFGAMVCLLEEVAREETLVEVAEARAYLLRVAGLKVANDKLFADVWAMLPPVA